MASDGRSSAEVKAQEVEAASAAGLCPTIDEIVWIGNGELSDIENGVTFEIFGTACIEGYLLLASPEAE